MLRKEKICHFIPRDDVTPGDWNQKTGLKPLIFKCQEPKIILGLASVSHGGADRVNIVSPSCQDENLNVLKGGEHLHPLLLKGGSEVQQDYQSKENHFCFHPSACDEASWNPDSKICLFGNSRGPKTVAPPGSWNSAAQRPQPPMTD